MTIGTLIFFLLVVVVITIKLFLIGLALLVLLRALHGWFLSSTPRQTNPLA
jgi:hypothetical protein